MPESVEPRGADLARQKLNEAMAVARKRGSQPAARTRVKRTRAQFGSGRDPQNVGGVIEQLVEAFGWARPSAGAQVLIRWDELAGDAARLAAAERYDADTRTLHLRPVSPAAATQLRLIGRRVAADVNERFGQPVVQAVRILPPGASRTDTPAGTSGVAPKPAQPAAPRTRGDASPGLQAAQAIVAAARAKEPDDPTREFRDKLFGDIRGTLREPLEAFTDGVALGEDLAETAARDDDPRERALAYARAEKAGHAPAVPRAFEQTA